MPYHFRNLVFEGGGVKGIAYLGAMEVLGRRPVLRDGRRLLQLEQIRWLCEEHMTCYDMGRMLRPIE